MHTHRLFPLCNVVSYCMVPPTTYLWQKAPALRLLLPAIAGILVQWYFSVSLLAIWICIGVLIILIALFSQLSLAARFKAAPLQGLALTLLITTVAMCLVQSQDTRKNKMWFGKKYASGDGLLLTLQEPLVEKPNSFKAVARVEKQICRDSAFPASGMVVLYFKKDAVTSLGYGSQLWTFKKVEAIKNSGNPGGFDFERYSLFQGITHQAYLTATDFVVLQERKTAWLNYFIFYLRDAIVTILKTHIRGAQESGLAEALLIGYKDDLDKTLVQSYSNTGVVHIIAISGLHVGLIYGLLLLLTKPLRGKQWRWLRCVIVLAALWAFGFLAGAQPSVMRSVVMFSFIASGVVLERNTSVYNNLALSALLLLCYNPFWLWDVGFQLSYSAVLSIIIFFKPIYNWVFLQNKALDAVWKLVAVTLAAQVLTTPLSLYYFHQFPVLFLFTNIVAVPLSSLVLLGEIAVCVFFFIPPVAHAIGWLTTLSIQFMNAYVQRMEEVSFSVWQGLSVSAVQAVLLVAVVAGISFWLLEKRRVGLWAALLFLLLFITLRTFSFIHAARQKELVVYNISKHRAIELYSGREACFAGDNSLMQNDPSVRLHLQPSRVLHRISSIVSVPTKAFSFCGKTILILDTTSVFQTFSKPHINVLVLSKNPKLHLSDLIAHFDLKQVVLDASVPPWKAAQWQRDLDSLHIPCYNVAQNGAFVMQVPRPTFAAR